MASEIACPSCGGEGTIIWKFDAWARFEIAGVDARGDLMRSAEFDTQVFDHNEIECSACGQLFNEKGMVELLRRPDAQTEE